MQTSRGASFAYIGPDTDDESQHVIQSTLFRDCDSAREHSSEQKSSLGETETSGLDRSDSPLHSEAINMPHEQLEQGAISLLVFMTRVLRLSKPSYRTRFVGIYMQRIDGRFSTESFRRLALLELVTFYLTLSVVRRCRRRNKNTLGMRDNPPIVAD